MIVRQAMIQLRLKLSLVALLLCAMFIGCNVGVSQSEMIRRAQSVKRSKDEEQTKADQPSSTQSLADTVKAPAAPEPGAPVIPVASAVGNGKVVDGVVEQNPSEADAKTVPLMAVAEFPLLVEEQQAKTLENLKVIGEALQRQMEDERKTVPPVAIYQGDNPLLSWRVRLLPYLGYDELYKQFNLNEAWDSPRNLNLLSQMPPEYSGRAAGEFKTTILAVQAGNSVFPGRNRLSVARIEDGLSNTLFLVDVDQTRATQWTRPQEWQASGRLMNALKNEAYGGFYVLWGNGRVSKLRNDLTDKQIYEAITIDNGEPISLSSLIAIEKTETLAEANSSDPTMEEKLSDSAEELLNVSVSDQIAAQQAAMEALAQGHHRRAMQFYHAGLILAEDAAVKDSFHWVSALKRPVAAVRFGIVVNTALGNDSIDDPEPISVKKHQKEKSITGPGSGLVDYFCGDLGQRTLRILDTHAQQGDFGSLVMDVPLQSSRQASGSGMNAKRLEEEGFTPVMLRPGVEVLGVMNRSTAVKAARRRELDFILLFEVEVKQPGNGPVQNNTRIEVINVRDSATVFETKSLNNIHVARSRRDPSVEDPVIEVMQSLDDFITRDCSVTVAQMPKLLPAHVAQRIQTILRDDAPRTLIDMAEIRFYLANGLVDQAVATQSMVQLAANAKTDLPIKLDQFNFDLLKPLVVYEEE
jgi:hypothetical protein